jgi:hypothetical protein
MEYGLGVDLGTTQTTAAIWIDGRAEVMPLGARRPGIPSMLFVKPDGGMLIGEAAERRGQAEPARLARDFKQRIGDPVPILAGDVYVSAHGLIAKLLRYVVDRVVDLRHEPPTSITMTHPATWGPYKRDLLRMAIRLAGVGPVELRTGPDAVALHHATVRHFRPGETVAVYYLGGSTFEAAVLRREGDGFIPLGEPDGIEQLGGIDFDQMVFGHVLGMLGNATDGMDPDDPEVIAGLARLRRDCVAAKEELSFESEVIIFVALPKLYTRVRLYRSELEAMIAPSLADTVAAMRRALRSAGVSAADLGGVLLGGGSSRIPLITQLLSTAFERPVVADPNPEFSLALGAAAAAEPGRGNRLDDDVQFTVYRPARLQPEVWQSMLLYAHKSDPIIDPTRGPIDPVKEVEERAAAHFQGEDVRANTVDARRPLAGGASLRIEPDLPGVRCDPTVAEIVWNRPVHEAHFRVFAPAGLAGTVVRGWIRVWCGLLLIGEVRVAIEVSVAGARRSPSALISQPVARYRKIFPSYSHADKAIVEQFEVAARALGDQYLQDVIVLRSGEDWNARLLSLIEDADIFQLFWSSNSMRSPHCRREWEKALALRRSMFVRPIYWEEPLPAAPAALRTLHFTKIPTALDLVPASSVGMAMPAQSLPPSYSPGSSTGGGGGGGGGILPLPSWSASRTLVGVLGLTAMVAVLILVVLYLI